MTIYRPDYSPLASKALYDAPVDVATAIRIDLQRFANFASNRSSGKHTPYVIEGKVSERKQPFVMKKVLSK